ncbi:MAG: hypothetical protein JST21_04620 [Bacteroidetes bacterium]|nr:hypothetical protein [Bacteroidota bacterium]
MDKTIERKNLILIDIQLDEMVSFKPSEEILIKSQKCILAYEELMQHQNSVTNKEIYCDWLEKHYDLFKSFDSTPIIYTDLIQFYDLYYIINELNDSLQYNDAATEQLKVFKL